ncbi:MAG: DivIVA domain-containing protein [Peptococcaceae bacterium]|nr:DivIVA domain-containing protein [Peptococcaceae bacterium]MBR2627239.1 DivIVA domain-containing protein [Peptococcaceae bacterium]
MLKPMDIHNKEFKKAMRGYDAEEVDEFLDEIIVDFEKLQRELDVLKTQLSNYSENMNSYREKEISLNNTLVSAQRFADQLVKDAETKAANIVAEAEAEAARIIGGTEAKYNKVLADYTMLATRYNDAKETLKEYFQNQIAMLDKEEAGINTEEVASYLKQAEALEAPAEAEVTEQTLSENEETKINVKLKEIMDNTDTK